LELEVSLDVGAWTLGAFISFVFIRVHSWLKPPHWERWLPAGEFASFFIRISIFVMCALCGKISVRRMQA
jgi:hypothetical protein